jgi:transposase
LSQAPAAVIRLKNELWKRLSRLIPVNSGRGRRPASDKQCFEAIVYLLRTGCQWSQLPPSEFPPKSTVHDAFTRWIRWNIFAQMWQELLLEYDDLKGLHWEWLSADGAMTKAPLGGELVGKKSDRPGKRRYKTPLTDRRRRDSLGRYCHWGQCS